MDELKEIKDDQIRIIGAEENHIKKRKSSKIWIVAIIVVVVVAVIGIFLLNKKEVSPSFFEPEIVEIPKKEERITRLDIDNQSFTEIRDSLINDIPLRLYIPHNATMSLHLGRMDKTDSTVIYAAQAADIRADNGGIVGAFVLKGKPLSWGLSKKGYCASIDGKVTIGVADNSPLFEEATDKGGYFFRQYPLVSNGVLVENEPKGKSIRRAICDRGGEIFMIETLSIESFHDFAQALVDLGVDQGVYLVGSSAYGWAVDNEGNWHEFGEDNYYTGRYRMPKNISYIVWRRNE